MLWLYRFLSFLCPLKLTCLWDHSVGHWNAAFRVNYQVSLELLMKVFQIIRSVGLKQKHLLEFNLKIKISSISRFPVIGIIKNFSNIKSESHSSLILHTFRIKAINNIFQYELYSVWELMTNRISTKWNIVVETN